MSNINKSINNSNKEESPQKKLINRNYINITDEELYIKRDIYPKLSQGKSVEIDNKINLIFYENNIDFSQFSSDIKIIVIYMPNFYSNNNNDNPLKFLETIKPKFKGHHQPRILNKNYTKDYNLANNLLIQKQIELAKSHGIYGFAIYYYWFSGKTIFDGPLNIIYNNNQDFHYMLIWKNEKVVNENNKIFLDEKYEENYSEKFIENIKKYLKDKLYIRINEKPIIGIYNPNAIPKLKETILEWRKYAIRLDIGHIFIISGLDGKNSEKIRDMKIFDGAYKSPPKDLIEKNIRNSRENYNYYYGLLYSNIIVENKTENFPVYKGSMLEWDNSAIKGYSKIYGEYSPEVFYIMNKLLIKWTKENYDQSNRLIFINAWNNYFEGTYLEPDERFGYASINALSKALFDLPFRNSNYNLSNLTNECLVAIQVHLFYEDLVNEVINITNNIPVKFDLYISTDTYLKMEYIKNNTDKYSKANNVIINTYENRGRDIYPFLSQMKERIYKYKYICHIHGKKSLFSPKYGFEWRTHLFANLLGTTDIISEILSDFENYDKLGFIFPDNYQDCVKFTMNIDFSDRKYMNSILNKIFPGYSTGYKFFDFPAGDMFWAKSKAIYQIFKLDLKDEIPYENQPKNILFAIERIWLFLVKMNGYYYKKYYKYYT